jgi:hypothetical protein
MLQLVYLPRSKSFFTEELQDRREKKERNIGRGGMRSKQEKRYMYKESRMASVEI